MLMDEPFSAVDPVVRGQLQDEFLRLQADLGKTIVFVTHDIDEAIKLGDQVAVLRVGGHLAQLATPADLLNSPSDDFVAGFVGRDRGYRALGFETAGELAVTKEQTVKASDPPTDAVRAGVDGWVLVVDDEDRPLGWYDVRAGTGPAAANNEIGRAHLNRAGTIAQQGGSLRAALDATLSSPSGRGVLTDQDGRLLGTITAREVLDRIEAGR
jgi:osmoprotectant transport system ATP-binding protein